MTDPETSAPGDDAVGPVAAGPTASPSSQMWRLLFDSPGESPSRHVTLTGYEFTTETARRAARERARTLLRRVLTEDQRATYDVLAYFDATAPSGRVYRVHCDRGREGNIALLDSRKDPVRAYCVAPGDPSVPDDDAYLAQLLLISTDERKFRRVAVPLPVGWQACLTASRTPPPRTRGRVAAYFADLLGL